MARLGHALMAEELTGMIKEADTNGGGMMNLQEFSRAITATAFSLVFLLHSFCPFSAFTVISLLCDVVSPYTDEREKQIKI
ncbi:hypothetical protein VNO80_07575 [Phaseolus coccineus]|uniref:EF-hand domain-containing protein n=1 Tax=Phaseolus coccineus TaxID=3886 RepID=A0AAN9RJR5_PHACN